MRLQLLPHQAVYEFTLVRTSLTESFGIFLTDGYITAIASDSAASQAGVQCGHIVLRVGDEPTINIPDVRFMEIFRTAPLSIRIQTMPAPVYYCLTSAPTDTAD